jgi:hypothetical protein
MLASCICTTARPPTKWGKALENEKTRPWLALGRLLPVGTHMAQQRWEGSDICGSVSGLP